MTCLNNINKNNKCIKESSFSDENTIKKLKLTSLVINKIISEKENYESREEDVPIKVTIEIERNKYTLVNIYQRIIGTYPVKTQFSEEEKISLQIVRGFDPREISINENYIYFPWFNWRIPSKMDSLVFTIGDYEVSRLELELGIIYDNVHVLEGFTVSEKLNQEFKELKEVIRSKSDFEHDSNSLLFQEYKIHFMPKPKYFSRCVLKLIKKISEDAILRSHLHTMKVTIDPYEDLSELEHRPPSIVVYPILSKRHAEQALTILFDHFKSDLKMGSQQNPRFNVETRNGLITYAQGDGYTKLKTLEKYPTLFSQIFDSDGVHFNRTFGAFPLAVPENF